MRKHDGKRVGVLYILAAVGWLGVLFWFSGQTGTKSNALSMEIVQKLFGWLLRYISFDALHVFIRKMAHFCAFAVEGWLLCSGLLRIMPEKRAAAVAGLSCAGVAALNELHQIFSEGRSCRVGDVLIDSAGALLGIAISVALLHAFSKLHRRKAKK